MTVEEQKLKLALQYALDKELEQYMDESNALPHTTKDLFYYRTRRKMLSAVSGHQQADSSVERKRSLKSARKTLRTALLVAALILLFTFSAFALQQVYEFYHVVDNPTDSDVFLTPDPNSKSDLFGKYTYIPEDFHKKSTYRSIWYREEEITYENADGDLLVCRSGMITPGGIHSFDTEHGELQETTVNGHPAMYIIMDHESAGTYSVLMWITGNTYHKLSYNCSSIEDLKKIAESRK